MRSLLVIVLASLALPAVSAAAPVRQPTKCKSAKRPVRVVVIGSSIANGVGATTVANSWAGRYSAYLKGLNRRNTLINLAVPGYVSPLELPTGSPPQFGRAIDTQHNITAALAKKPNAVILSLTGNDASAGIPAADTIANFRTIVKAANKRRVRVWVTSPTPRNLDAAGLQRLSAVRTETKTTFGRYSVDFWAPTAGTGISLLPSLDSGDALHPNDEGHRVLYKQVVKEKIPKALACR